MAHEVAEVVGEGVEVTEVVVTRLGEVRVGERSTLTALTGFCSFSFDKSGALLEAGSVRGLGLLAECMAFFIAPRAAPASCLVSLPRRAVVVGA